MLKGGSFEPCAQIVLTSIGKLGVEENKQYSAQIAALLESSLGVPKNRAYIFFQEVNNFSTSCFQIIIFFSCKSTFQDEIVNFNICINFLKVQAYQVGFNGSTFA